MAAELTAAAKRALVRSLATMHAEQKCDVWAEYWRMTGLDAPLSAALRAALVADLAAGIDSITGDPFMPRSAS